MVKYMITKSDNDVDFDLYFYDSTLKTYFFIKSFRYNSKVADIIKHIRDIYKDTLVQIEWCF